MEKKGEKYGVKVQQLRKIKIETALTEDECWDKDILYFYILPPSLISASSLTLTLLVTTKGWCHFQVNFR